MTPGVPAERDVAERPTCANRALFFPERSG